MSDEDPKPVTSDELLREFDPLSPTHKTIPEMIPDVVTTEVCKSSDGFSATIATPSTITASSTITTPSTVTAPSTSITSPNAQDVKIDAAPPSMPCLSPGIDTHSTTSLAAQKGMMDTTPSSAPSLTPGTVGIPSITSLAAQEGTMDIAPSSALGQITPRPAGSAATDTTPTDTTPTNIVMAIATSDITSEVVTHPKVEPTSVVTITPSKAMPTVSKEIDQSASSSKKKKRKKHKRASVSDKPTASKSHVIPVASHMTSEQITSQMNEIDMFLQSLKVGGLGRNVGNSSTPSPLTNTAASTKKVRFKQILFCTHYCEEILNLKSVP